MNYYNRGNGYKPVGRIPKVPQEPVEATPSQPPVEKFLDYPPLWLIFILLGVITVFAVIGLYHTVLWLISP